MLTHTQLARQAGTGQVPATVPATITVKYRVPAGRTPFGEASRVLRHQSYPQVELRDADREASCPAGAADPAGDRGEDS